MIGAAGTEAAVRRLWDLEAVRQLKARYARYVDQQRWDDLRGLFADDARFEGFWAKGDGPDEFVASARQNLTGSLTVHTLGQSELAHVDDWTIRGTWALIDYLEWEPGTRGYRGVEYPGQRGVRGYGYYEEEYALTAAGWRIRFLRLTRLRIDPLFGPPEPRHPDFVELRDDSDWVPIVGVAPVAPDAG